MNFALTELELPVYVRTARPLTDEELFQFCARNELLQIEREADGELHIMSPTGLEGDSWTTDIGADLTIWARQDGRGRTFGSNAGFTLPDTSMRSPDAAWVSWELWNALPSDQQKRFGRLVPEFIIELRSETDRLPDLQAKMQKWMRNGVQLAWLIDPQRKAVEIYRPGQNVETQEQHSAVYGDGPVAGFVLELARIWS